MVESLTGHKVGDDDGCFAAALDAVREWGGVLEHPAWSLAWAAHGLPTPNSSGGWQRTVCGGAVCYVEQGRYGHQARKATWLYAFGCELPSLRWGRTPDGVAGDVKWRAEGVRSKAVVSFCGNRTPRDERPRLTRKQASATPESFRDVLIAMARYARG